MLDLNNKEILEWPALQKKNKFLDLLSPEDKSKSIARAVFGKADGVGSDYRMLVKSDGFTGTILNAAYIGDPTEAETLSWFIKEDKVCATHYYPSKARDSSNRLGGLEKHSLEVSKSDILESPYPYILFQLALLIRVQKYNNEIWWETRKKVVWQDRLYKLEIPNDPAISREEITIAIEELQKGITTLKKYFTKSSLIEFYLSILLNDQFIVPTSIGRTEIPINVFLALFLPLDDEFFSQWSFILKIPNDWRVDLSKITTEWNVIPNFEKFEQSPIKKDDDILKLAETFSDAIYNQKPPEFINKTIINSKNETLIGLTNQEKQKSEKEKIDPIPLNKRRIAYHENLIATYSNCYFYKYIKGDEPYEDSDEQVKKLFSFICSSKMHIEEGYFTGFPIKLESFDQELLKTWHDKITKEKYKDGSSNIINYKIEYMKAAYCYLSMNTETIRAVLAGKERLKTQRIPLLLFLLNVEPDKLNNSFKDNIETDELVMLFNQSESLPHPSNYHEKVKEFIITFVKSKLEYSKVIQEKFLNLLENTSIQ